MKIAILSTPKTGNVWLTTLLKELYGVNIPAVDSSNPYLTPDTLETLGNNWIIYAHVYPVERTITWLTSRNVHVLTTVRHPCDVLVSLRHYVSWSPHNRDDPARAMLTDDGGYADASVRYVLDHFPNLIGISLAWSRLGATVVRYEDLIADPIERVRRLTDGIEPVTSRELRKAVLLSQFKRMKAAADPKSGLQPWSENHFRLGRVGGWRSEIADSPLLDVLRSQEPFVTQFQALGYSLDDATPAPFSYAAIDPFRDQDRFDNGVRLSPIMIRCYFDHPGAEETWPNPLETSGPSSFYDWLNEPSDLLDGAKTGEVLLTNLAEGLYRFRRDLQKTFQDPISADRLAFAWWFLTYGVEEHRIPAEFAVPIQQSLAQLSPRLGPMRPDLAVLADPFSAE